MPPRAPIRSRIRHHAVSVLRAGGGALKVALMLLCGTALGLGATAFTLDRHIDPGAVKVGPWVTWIKVGTSDIDPYAKAVNALTGAIALAAAEGLSFLAAADDTGAALSTRCHYRVAGSSLSARYWTLAATTPAGRVMDNAAGRSGFSSIETLRRDDGSFVIDISRSARPGNWLPISGEGRFVLTLRLYDSPLTSVAGDIHKATLPTLTPSGCAS